MHSLFIEIGYYYKLDIYHLYRRCLAALFLFRIACIFSHLGLVFEFYSTYAKISFLHILKLNSSCTFCTTEIDSWHLHIFKGHNNMMEKVKIKYDLYIIISNQIIHELWTSKVILNSNWKPFVLDGQTDGCSSYMFVWIFFL